MNRFACPACDRPLYNRRRTNCEFCGATVPASLLLTPVQQARIDEIRSGDRRRAQDPGILGDSPLGAGTGSFDFGPGSDAGSSDCGGGGGGCDGGGCCG